MWTQYWPVYERLEREFCDLTFFISLDDVHLNVYSLKLAELLLRIGQECENAGKTLAVRLQLSPATGTIDGLNFPSLGDLLCSYVPLNSKIVEVVWLYQSLSINSRSLAPLSKWSSTATASTNPSWYRAYNGLKHDRNTNFQQARLGNVLEALAGLFILNLWIRKDNIEKDSEWIELARRRIMSYSQVFDPSGLLQLSAMGGVNKRLELV